VNERLRSRTEYMNGDGDEGGDGGGRGVRKKVTEGRREGYLDGKAKRGRGDK
jgi:hypothetical protein